MEVLSNGLYAALTFFKALENAVRILQAAGTFYKNSSCRVTEFSVFSNCFKKVLKIPVVSTCSVNIVCEEISLQ